MNFLLKERKGGTCPDIVGAFAAGLMWAMRRATG